MEYFVLKDSKAQASRPCLSLYVHLLFFIQQNFCFMTPMEETHQVVIRATWQPLLLIKYGRVCVLTDLSSYTILEINSNSDQFGNDFDTTSRTTRCFPARAVVRDSSTNGLVSCKLGKRSCSRVTSRLSPVFDM